MTYIVMAYIVMAYIVMAYIVMAYIVMAYIVMAYIVGLYRYGLHEPMRHDLDEPMPVASRSQQAILYGLRCLTYVSLVRYGLYLPGAT